MFSLSVVDTDLFLDMPQSTQNLYFHLGMRADDDGFVSNTKKIMKMIGATDDDIKLLIAKQYIIPFDSGIIVIKHWRMNNYLRNDRYKETNYKEEKKQIVVDDNLVYQMDTNGIHRLGKDSIGKDIEKENIKEKEKYGEFKNVLLTEEEYHKLEESNLLPYIEKLSSYIASKGKKYKSHYATILTWSRKDKKQSDYKYHAPEPEWLNKEIKEEEMSDEVKQLLEYVNSKD
jgi:hypothetical protein